MPPENDPLLPPTAEQVALAQATAMRSAVAAPASPAGDAVQPSRVPQAAVAPAAGAVRADRAPTVRAVASPDRPAWAVADGGPAAGATPSPYDAARGSRASARVAQAAARGDGENADANGAARPVRPLRDDRAAQAAAKPTARRRTTADPRTRSFVRRRRALVAAVVVAATAIVVTLVVRWSPLFEIHRITATPTEHISSTTISTLAAVPEGSTLFNVDVRGIQDRLAANPWVGSVRIGRTLPDQLDIYVAERTPAAIIMMSNGTEAWRISDTGYWLEPIALREATSPDDRVATPVEQAQAQAQVDGVVFVTEVASTLRPGAGKACDNDGVNALLSYLSAFGPDLCDQIVTARASSREALSVTLANGVEVSLGAPTDIAVKEQVVLNMLREHAGEVTYINVRVTTAPTWRGVTSGDTVAAESTEPVEDKRSGDDLGAEQEQIQQSSGPVEGTSWADAMFEGGYYDEDGDWIWSYYSDEGEWIHGYYGWDGEWVQLSDAPPI